MDGIINLNKPVGITSAKALYRVRAIVGERKSGHGGTLDPMACGVLLICLGKATKLVERIMDQPKVYRAAVRLDVTSDSFDAEAEVRDVSVESIPKECNVGAALAAFEGDIAQVPPSVSALKVGGIPAYKRARRGESLVLEPRRARIYWIRMQRFTWPELEFDVCCGRGTYVRAVVRDLGQALGTGGCLTRLERTQIGPFTINDSWSFESLDRDTTSDYLVSLPEAVRILETVTVPASPD